jgi:hypothetical protein
MGLKLFVFRGCVVADVIAVKKQAKHPDTDSPILRLRNTDLAHSPKIKFKASLLARLLNSAMFSANVIALGHLRLPLDTIDLSRRLPGAITKSEVLNTLSLG